MILAEKVSERPLLVFTVSHEECLIRASLVSPYFSFQCFKYGTVLPGEQQLDQERMRFRGRQMG